MHRTPKSLVAAATTVALLVLGAAPSAANTGTVTGGTATLNVTPPATSTLGTAGCDSSIDVDLAGHDPTSTSTGTADLIFEIPTNVLADAVILFTTTVDVDIDHTTTPDTIALTGPTGGGFTVTPLGVYATTGPGSCTTVGTPKCFASAANFSTGLTGTFTGTVASTAPHDLSGTAHLAGTAGTAASCTPPFTALNGKTLTLASVTVGF